MLDDNNLNQYLKLYEKGQLWILNKKNVAIATVVKTWGSSPRPLGSQMIISQDLDIEGSVSGGCIEGSVIESALEIMKGKPPKVLHFGVSNEVAWEVGLTCGGKVSVFIESFNKKMEQSSFRELINNIKRKSQTLYISNLEKNECFLKVGDQWSPSKPSFFSSEIKDSCLMGDDKWFAHFYFPSTRLIIIGAVHISQSLVSMAAECNFDPQIIDPRGVFITKERFPNSILHTKWPEDFLKEEPANKDTAIVTLSHDPKLDDPALEHALNSNAFYIACLGSKKTHSSRLERLRLKGFNDKVLSRLNGPAGIPISAKSPSEIAVSILAEMISFRQKLKKFQTI